MVAVQDTLGCISCVAASGIMPILFILSYIILFDKLYKQMITLANLCILLYKMNSGIQDSILFCDVDFLSLFKFI